LLSVVKDPGLQVFVVDKLPAVPIPEATQSGSALSGWIKNQNGDLKPAIFLQKDRWESQKDDLSRARMIHHELCVLSGCETTGDYHKTDQFERELRTGYVLHLDDPVICTLMLFDAEKTANGKTVAGAYRSATAFSSLTYSSKGGLATLVTANPDRILRIPYAVGTSGFLKMQVIESDPIPQNEDRIFIQKNGRVLVYQEMVFNPYDEPIETGQAVKDIPIKDKYVIRASCMHQEAPVKRLSVGETLLQTGQLKD
jgi:hypothetical protein